MLNLLPMPKLDFSHIFTIRTYWDFRKEPTKKWAPLNLWPAILSSLSCYSTLSLELFVKIIIAVFHSFKFLFIYPEVCASDRRPWLCLHG